MATLLEKLIKLKAKEFDLMRKFFLPDKRCFLIRRKDQQSRDFVLVSEVETGWYLYFSEYYQSFKLQVSTNDSGFENLINQTSDIAIGDQVYIIDPERRVVIKPSGEDPFWLVYCELSNNETFEMPSE